AVWLLAEGLRLLGGAFLRTASQVPGGPGSPPTYRRTRTILGFLLLLVFVLLLLQKAYAVYDPPDVIEEQGILEGVDGETISGWARLKNQPKNPVTVEIYEGDTLLATVVAEQSRPDLRDLHIGNGENGFGCPIPARLKDWRPHEIRAKIA